VTCCERVCFGNDQNQIIFVNDIDGKTNVLYWKRDDAEIDFTVENRFKRTDAVGADDGEIDARVLLLELGKDSGQHIEACSLIGPDGNFAAWRAMQFADGNHDVVMDLEAMFREGLEEASSSGEGDLAAVAIKETRTCLVFERSYLRGDGWLRDAQLLGR